MTDLPDRSFEPTDGRTGPTAPLGSSSPSARQCFDTSVHHLQICGACHHDSERTGAEFSRLLAPRPVDPCVCVSRNGRRSRLSLLPVVGTCRDSSPCLFILDVEQSLALCWLVGRRGYLVVHFIPSVPTPLGLIFRSIVVRSNPIVCPPSAQPKRRNTS